MTASEPVSERDTPSIYNLSYDEEQVPQRELTDFIVTAGNEKISICSLDDSRPASDDIVVRGLAIANGKSLRVVSAPLIEWCIEYGQTPHLWVRSARVWYRLTKPAKEYSKTHEMARRRFEVCSRIYILGTTMTPADCTYKLFLQLLASPYLQMKAYSEKEILTEKDFILAQIENLNDPGLAGISFVKELREKKFVPGKKSTHGSKKSSDGSKKSNDGSKKSNDGSKKSNDGSKKSNDGSKKSNDGGKKSNDGGKKSNDGSKKSSDGSKKSSDGSKKSSDGNKPSGDASKKTSSASVTLGSAGEYLGPWVPSGNLDTEGNTRLLKRVEKVLNQIYKSKNAWPFREPVDPQRDGCPDYFDRIKKPMDLGTIKKNYEKGMYTSAIDVANDVRLVASNCREYNGEANDFPKWATELEQKFENLMRGGEDAELAAMNKRTSSKKRKASDTLHGSSKGVGKKSVPKISRKNSKSSSVEALGPKDTAVKGEESSSQSVVPKRCARASSEGCQKYQAGGSKYCSDECGMIVARRRLAELLKAGFSADEYIKNCVTKAVV